MRAVDSDGEGRIGGARGVCVAPDKCAKNAVAHILSGIEIFVWNFAPPTPDVCESSMSLLEFVGETMSAIDCLYCGERRPHSDEHILQKSLGGNLTFKNVCKLCNESFSAIDQALSDNSEVALSRLIETPTSKKVKRSSSELIYDPQSALWKEVSVGNQLSVEVLPQLHYRQGRVILSGHAAEPLRAFVAALERFVETGKCEAHPIKIDESCETSRIALIRKGKFIVRAPSLELGLEFLGKLQRNWSEIRSAISSEPQAGTVTNPEMRGELRVDHNGSFRAVAKSVFNYLAYRQGVGYARSSAFEDIRGYIRGKSVVLPNQSEDMLGVDTRFVLFANYGDLNLMSTKTHCIVIFNMGNSLCGVLTLYANLTFVVLLGPSDRDFIGVAHEFSTDGSWNRELSLEEMMVRRREAMIGESKISENES